jgi:hypothetical protein
LPLGSFGRGPIDQEGRKQHARYVYISISPAILKWINQSLDQTVH